MLENRLTHWNDYLFIRLLSLGQRFECVGYWKVDGFIFFGFVCNLFDLALDFFGIGVKSAVDC